MNSAVDEADNNFPIAIFGDDDQEDTDEEEYQPPPDEDDDDDDEDDDNDDDDDDDDDAEENENEDEDVGPRGEIEGGGEIVDISDDQHYYEKGTIVDLEREDDNLKRVNNTICNEKNDIKGKDFRLLFSILL